MADGYIAVAPDSNGKFLQTFENSVSGNVVHAEAVALVDTTGTFLSTLPVSGPLTNAELRGSAVPVSGTVTANQGGSWFIDAISSTTTVNSPNASNFLATVTGTVAATQSGTWNIGTVASITATSNVAVTKFTGAPTMANGQIAATNVAATLVAARATRRSVSIRNLDSTNSGYIGLPVIASSNGMLLGPKDSISVDYTGLIQVITASGTANFAYLETYD